MNSMPTISAIIVAYDSEELIVRSVRAALDAGVSNVYVWDNSPRLGSVEALNDFADQRLVVLSDGINHGFGGGINRVLEGRVAGDLVLLVNPDCFVTADVVHELTGLFDDPRTGIAAPRMIYENGAPGIAGGPFPSLVKEFFAKLRVDEVFPAVIKRQLLALFSSKRNGFSLADSMKPGAPASADWVSGFCMMIRKSVLDELDGFDEDYFLYFEDVDICRRASLSGYDVKLARNFAALHLESTSTQAVGKSAHYYKGLSVYLAKHGTLTQTRMARLLGLTK
jgi:N-acetylglucosaminyl-diphospho-decaprenol L-rhamnosyltransferase